MRRFFSGLVETALPAGGDAMRRASAAAGGRTATANPAGGDAMRRASGAAGGRTATAKPVPPKTGEQPHQASPKP